MSNFKKLIKVLRNMQKNMVKTVDSDKFSFVLMFNQATASIRAIIY